jgi:hypothetical protein
MHASAGSIILILMIEKLQKKRQQFMSNFQGKGPEVSEIMSLTTTFSRMVIE